MEEELITLTKSELQELLSNNNSKVVIVSKPTANSLFRDAAITPNDIRAINGMYEKSSVNNLNTLGGTTFSRHQTFSYNNSFGRKRLEDDGPFSSDIHELIRKLTLAIMGERLNKNLSYEDWSEAREDYIQIKNLFLSLYNKRLNKLFQGR